MLKYGSQNKYEMGKEIMEEIHLPCIDDNHKLNSSQKAIKVQ